jgi:hypothetical protein
MPPSEKVGTLLVAHYPHMPPSVNTGKSLLMCELDKRKMSLKRFSAFIALKKYQFASKLLRMVQLVYQIGI